MPIVLRLCCLAAVIGFPLTLKAAAPPCKSEKLPVHAKKGVKVVSEITFDFRVLIEERDEARNLKEGKAEEQLETESLVRRIQNLEKKVSAQCRELNALRCKCGDRKQAAAEASESLPTPIDCPATPAQTSREEDDIVYINQRGFQIPLRILPKRQREVREILLYMSCDQGRTWQICARVPPEAGCFNCFTSKDGLLYFSVAAIDKKGCQDPPDISRAPVGQKILIDTVEPAVRIVSVKRVGDTVRVDWKIREQHPEWTSLKMEYKASGSPEGGWTPLAIRPGEHGDLRFSPEAPGPLTLRLTVSDMAGNKSRDSRVVPERKPHARSAPTRYEW